MAEKKRGADKALVIGVQAGGQKAECDMDAPKSTKALTKDCAAVLVINQAELPSKGDALRALEVITRRVSDMDYPAA